MILPLSKTKKYVFFYEVLMLVTYSTGFSLVVQSVSRKKKKCIYFTIFRGKLYITCSGGLHIYTLTSF